MKIPQVIPPKSIVRLSRYDDTTPEWRKSVGRTFRIGYYSRRDGLDCIWLVNDAGEYEQTTDRQSLLMYFDIIRLSHESNHFGTQRPPLRPIAQRLSAS